MPPGTMVTRMDIYNGGNNNSNSIYETEASYNYGGGDDDEDDELLTSDEKFMNLLFLTVSFGFSLYTIFNIDNGR